MFFGIKWQVLVGLVLAGMLMMAGSFGAGHHYGAKGVEAKYTARAVSQYKKDVTRALDIADSFLKLGRQLATKMETIDTETQVVYQTQVKYVREKPLPAVCVLDGRIVELRNQQIDRIWTALGRELPRERRQRPPVPALPNQQPAGTDRR